MNSTTKLLKVLFNMDKHLDELQSASDLSKEFIDSYFEIREANTSDIYEEIISSSKDQYHLHELNRLVSSIRESIKRKEGPLQQVSYDALLKSALLPYEEEIDRISKELKICYKRVNELSNTLEARVFLKGADIPLIDKEHTEEKNRYQQLQEVQKEAYNEHDKYFKENSRILSFSFNDLDELLDSFKKRFEPINDVKETNKQSDLETDNTSVKKEKKTSIFTRPTVSSDAYKLFIHFGFIEEIDPSSFYRQLSLVEEFTMKKQPRNDKYIAYAISQLSQFIKPSIKKEWEAKMADNFGINNYEKVSKVKDSKNEKHERIDEMLSEF